jgi:hypothetical protein
MSRNGVEAGQEREIVMLPLTCGLCPSSEAMRVAIPQRVRTDNESRGFTLLNSSRIDPCARVMLANPIGAMNSQVSSGSLDPVVRKNCLSHNRARESMEVFVMQPADLRGGKQTMASNIE